MHFLIETLYYYVRKKHRQVDNGHTLSTHKKMTLETFFKNAECYFLSICHNYSILAIKSMIKPFLF